MATDNKLEYLYASLADLQSTIRAVDTKVSYLLVILFIPLTRLGVIYRTLNDLLTCQRPCLPVVSGILVFGFVAVWALGFWLTLRTLIAIDDPMHQIDGERPESHFYPAHLFRHGFWSVMGLTRTKSTTQFNRHYASIPSNEEDVIKHVTLEQMKTMFILSLKISRSVFAYYATIAWVILGGVLWFLHLVWM